MRHIDVPQGSAAWLEARSGKVTASRIAAAISTLKRGGERETAERRNYRIQLVAERLTGRAEDNYVSPEMAWGTEYESQARSAYEIEAGVMVETVGLVLHPIWDFAGASPDGLIGEDGALEIKCPKTTTHIKWMLDGKVPEEHQLQCLWVMICAERNWCEFVSYDPRLPEGLKLFKARMERDEERVSEVSEGVMQFHSEVDELVEFLAGKIVVPPPKPIDPRSDYEQLMSMIDRMEVTP